MSESWVVVVRYGEIGVKGRATRSRMEKLLVKNIKSALMSINASTRVVRGFGRIYVTDFSDEKSAETCLGVLARVMGVVSLSPAYTVKFADLSDLVEKAYKFFKSRARGSSFAVRVRRVGEHGFTSMDVSRALGERIAGELRLKVDLSNPEYTAHVEIRGWRAYFYDKIVRGPGGLPIGSEGRVLVLFSGGFDSPVAAWFMMRRGCIADLVLFNIGGSEQLEIAKAVAHKLAIDWSYGYEPKLYVIDLRPLIPRIVSNVPEDYIVIVLRRLMLRTASKLAEKIGAKALVTGESLGQVASQTLDNLTVIDRASTIPVLRPLIGFDKDEIIKYAKLIGTYDYSSKMREYCLVGARRVNTHASLEKVVEYEEKLGISSDVVEELLEECTVYDVKKLVVGEKHGVEGPGCPR